MQVWSEQSEETLDLSSSAGTSSELDFFLRSGAFVRLEQSTCPEWSCVIGVVVSVERDMAQIKFGSDVPDKIAFFPLHFDVDSCLWKEGRCFALVREGVNVQGVCAIRKKSLLLNRDGFSISDVSDVRDLLSKSGEWLISRTEQTLVRHPKKNMIWCKRESLTIAFVSSEQSGFPLVCLPVVCLSVVLRVLPVADAFRLSLVRLFVVVFKVSFFSLKRPASNFTRRFLTRFGISLSFLKFFHIDFAGCLEVQVSLPQHSH